MKGSASLPSSSPASKPGRFGPISLSALVVALATGDIALAAEAAPAADESHATSSASTGIDAPPPSSAVRWATTSELSGTNYRFSASRGALDLGMRLDTPSVARQSADRRLEPVGPYVQTLPALNLGVRTVDLAPGSLLRQLSGAEAASATTHRVGIEWKPAESQMLFLRGGLGVRLSGDDRVTMRLRKGTLGLYMKQDF